MPPHPYSDTDPQPWHRTKSPWSPLLIMEQETKEDGLIRRALSSLFDPFLPSAPHACCDATFVSGRMRRGAG